jgi:hypothetical protein
VTSAAWRVAMKIETKVGDMVQRAGDDQTHVGYSVVGRLRGRVTLCVVCTMHKEARSTSFLV